jgi:hypothetical protein
MAKKNDPKQEAKWSWIYWGGGAVVAFIFGLWCVWDGWFATNHDWATFNQVMAPVSFLVAIWLVWQGKKEVRQIQKRAAEQGSAEEAAKEQEPAERN